MATINWQLIKESASKAIAIVGIGETAAAVIGLSLADVMPKEAGWFERLGIFILCYITLCALIVLYSYLRDYNGVVLKINNTEVAVAIGDLFAGDGLKVIPFDERYDTTVDDRVISKKSLNGIFIEQYADKEKLSAFLKEEEDTTLAKPARIDGDLRYPLGTVKTYEDYALVSFTHMDRLNCAHLSRSEYEGCLMGMWRELSRVYAGKKIILPLLGSGITRFDDGRPKDDELLRCLLCTLRASGQSYSSGVEIVLTDKTAAGMRLYQVRQYTKTWQ